MMEQNKIGFVVFGPPQPWQRAGTTRSGRHYTLKETLQYERAIKNTAMLIPAIAANHGRDVPGHAFTLDNPGRSWDLHAIFSLDVRVRFANARRRDLDNVLKAISDAGNGILWDDDAHVDIKRIERVYDGLPRTELVVTCLRLLEAPKRRARRPPARPLGKEPVPQGYEKSPVTWWPLSGGKAGVP